MTVEVAIDGLFAQQEREIRGSAICVHILGSAPRFVGTPCLGPPNDMTLAVATNRLLYVPPCVYTAFGVYRFAYSSLNNMTPAVAIDRLLRTPHCVYTAFCVYRFA